MYVYIYVCMYVYTYMYYMCRKRPIHMVTDQNKCTKRPKKESYKTDLRKRQWMKRTTKTYGVATISRLLKIIRLFCRI